VDSEDEDHNDPEELLDPEPDTNAATTAAVGAVDIDPDDIDPDAGNAHLAAEANRTIPFPFEGCGARCAHAKGFLKHCRRSHIAGDIHCINSLSTVLRCSFERCPHCDKLFKSTGVRGHISKMHPELAATANNTAANRVLPLPW
jgi:hypothetical protein